MDTWKSLLIEICQAVDGFFAELELETGRNGCMLFSSGNINPNGFEWADLGLANCNILAIRIPKLANPLNAPSPMFPNQPDIETVEHLVRKHPEFVAIPNLSDCGPNLGEYLLVAKRPYNHNNIIIRSL